MSLCRLELMKIRSSSYAAAAVGIITCLAALGILFLFIFQIEEEEAELFSCWNGLLALTTALAFTCFSVFSAIMASRVIVSEYCGENAVVLLTCPVRKRAILGVKCRILLGGTMGPAVMGNVLTLGVMYISARIFGITPRMDTDHFFLTVLGSGILMGILAFSAGVISAAFGWKKRSVTGTVVCSLIIVCAGANFIAISPDNIILVLLAMCVVFGGAAALSYHALRVGIERMEV